MTFSGKEYSSDEFEKLVAARDGEKRVVVVTSTEAVEGHGLAAVQQKASDKYDAGNFMDEMGRIRVFKSEL